ncbi:MAG: tryptophan synthase subunit alpha [Deltaproteobacteria bacterium]|nr:MAG: tryptophan synthase subunit alpha [Deltaproteobacteria bacterium]
MNNRIVQLFSSRPDDKILSVFMTAGFPSLDSTLTICQTLEASGVDMIELGFPYSDPLADGPTIQASSEAALKNGMNLTVLFEQLKALRDNVNIPVLLMGYLNPVLQYGMERFCKDCQDVGIDGLILPDLPFDEYLSEYRELWEAHSLSAVFLVTQFTSEERVRAMDAATQGFLYIVSSSAVTGDRLNVDQQREAYFKRIQDMNLSNPAVVGFGIRDPESFQKSTKFANGGIIGSAFIEAIREADNLEETIQQWVAPFRT